MSEVRETNYVSSTGLPGTHPRSPDRLYHNAEEYIAAPDRLLEMYADLLQEADSIPKVSRAVLRGIASDDIKEHIDEGALRLDLEVALPLHEFGISAWLIGLGRNGVSRQSRSSLSEMVKATSQFKPTHLTPYEKVQAVIQGGAEVTSSLHSYEREDLLRIWQPSFEWKRPEIEGFADRLQEELGKPESERSIWFSAVRQSGRLISSAMAETLELPGPHNTITLVESTEWCTLPEFAGQGIMAATLAGLHAQIINARRNHNDTEVINGTEVIFAECNTTDSAPWVGHGSGLRVPRREFAPQILRQNVTVGDNKIPAGLRDFVFMYMTGQTREEFYNPDETQRILDSITIPVL